MRHETRVALFQQSLDTRITSEHLRDRSTRVTFGNSWLENSILELYKEDILRFRVMLMTDVENDPLKELAREMYQNWKHKLFMIKLITGGTVNVMG